VPPEERVTFRIRAGKVHHHDTAEPPPLLAPRVKASKDKS